MGGSRVLHILTASGKKLVESGGSGMDALVSSSRWQDGEESMRGMGVLVHNAGVFADAEIVLRAVDGV